jgi:hypothetical protein
MPERVDDGEVGSHRGRIGELVPQRPLLAGSPRAFIGGVGLIITGARRH